MDQKLKDDQIQEKQSHEIINKQETCESTSSYKEYIREKIRDKADKFQKGLLSFENKSVDFLNNVYRIVQKNHQIREYLKSLRNYYMNYFFNYFGYRYESIIENPNFFHFISQAWLVNAFEEIKETTISENENYSTILEKLFDVEISKKKLISSLELITETIYVSDPAIKLTEVTLGKNFLKHIKIVLNDWKSQYNKASLNKKEFGNIIMDILSKTVNLTINEIDTLENENNDLIFYNTYNEMIAINQELTLEEYICKVEELRNGGKNKDNSHDITITNACEAFFFFTQTSLSLLIIDLEMFNQQYTSLISKIRIVINKKGKSVQEYLSKFTEEFCKLYINLKNDAKNKNLFEFYNTIYDKILLINESSKIMVVSKYKNYKEWINSIDMKNVFSYPKFVVGKLNNLSSNSTLFIYQKIYQPTKDITFTTTGYSYNFIIKNVDNAKNISLDIYSSMKENALKIIDEYFDKYVKIDVDEDKDTIVIQISRKILSENSSKLVSFTFEYLKKIKINKVLTEMLQKSIETSLQLKDRIIEKYRRLLCLSSKSPNQEKL